MSTPEILDSVPEIPSSNNHLLISLVLLYFSWITELCRDLTTHYDTIFKLLTLVSLSLIIIVNLQTIITRVIKFFKK
jgi:hypothetical protein